MTFTRRKLLTLIAVGAGFAVLLVAFFPGQPQPEPLPTPNGYDDFLKAASLLPPPLQDPATASDSDLRQYVDQSASARDLIRSGLMKESKVPVRFSRDFPDSHFPELASIKSLGSMMSAIAVQQLRQQHTNDAAETYGELMRLAHHSLNGGVLVDSQLNAGMQALATKLIRALVPHLDGPSCGKVITTLETIDANEESFDEIAARERKWSKAVRRLGDYWAMRGWIMRERSLDLLKGPLDMGRDKHARMRHQRYQLIAQLAARAFELEHGRAPKSWSDLSPAYIKTVPAEFRSGTNAVYQFQVVFAPPGS